MVQGFCKLASLKYFHKPCITFEIHSKFFLSPNKRGNDGQIFTQLKGVGLAQR